MRIGIVVEGPTDVHATVYFLQKSLESRGIIPSFVDLQPVMDNTCPDGGWATVLKWLEFNPPIVRILKYFDGGLFEDNMSAKECDVILFHLDSDVLSHVVFRNFVEARFNYGVQDPDDPSERGSEIRRIIALAGNFAAMSHQDRVRHIAAPAVEATEAWCIGIFRRRKDDPEELRGLDLVRAFMNVLHRSESRPEREFATIDKSTERRKRFCQGHAGGFRRLERQCQHYGRLVQTLVEVQREL